MTQLGALGCDGGHSLALFGLRLGEFGGFRAIFAAMKQNFNYK